MIFQSLFSFASFDHFRLIIGLSLWCCETKHHTILNDIEDFYNRIKISKISRSISDLTSFHAPPVTTFHLSSLSDEDEKNYNSTQNLYKVQSILAKDQQNYALSVCFRKTFIRVGKDFFVESRKNRLNGTQCLRDL